MAKKGLSIAGGILALLGASGLFALWWFVLGPALATASSLNLLWTLFMGDLLGIWNSGINWMMMILGLPLEILMFIGIQIVTMPVSVNFWGVIKLDPFICVIVLVGLIALGAILAMAGAGED